MIFSWVESRWAVSRLRLSVRLKGEVNIQKFNTEQQYSRTGEQEQSKGAGPFSVSKFSLSKLARVSCGGDSIGYPVKVCTRGKTVTGDKRSNVLLFRSGHCSSRRDVYWQRPAIDPRANPKPQIQGSPLCTQTTT